MRAALEMICGHTCRIGAGSAEPNLKDQSEEEARVRQRAAESRPQSFSAASHESENRRIGEIFSILFTSCRTEDAALERECHGSLRVKHSTEAYSGRAPA